MNTRTRGFVITLTAAALLAHVHVSAEPSAVLAQVDEYQKRFRSGDAAVVDALVSMLEREVATHPDQSLLWTALGRAYFSKISSLANERNSGSARFMLLQQARDAYARALTLDAKNDVALSGHGMAITILGGAQRDAEAFQMGVTQMNQAVARSPDTTAVRLVRAFTAINLPPQVRSNDDIVADLNYLIDEVPGSRAADVLHLLLGDLRAEMGDADAARIEYESIAGASAFAAEQVRSRLLALDRGNLSPQDFADVRSRLGRECTMCHAK